MRDYKESIGKGTRGKRGVRQVGRLFAIMGGMILAFAIFIGGVLVGIQVERERVRIVAGVGLPGEGVKVKEEEKRAQVLSSQEKQQKNERFTFYETLTKKGEEDKKVQGREEKKLVEEPKSAPVYFVQVASFKEEATAEGLKNRLLKKGYPAEVVPVELARLGLWYRVRIGGFKTLQEAEAAQKMLATEENIDGTKVVSGR